MDSPPPAPWTYAARAAYFGDRVCPFCDHHNPAGARFCNDCSAPLHLKPCNECDAVNHQAATNCYKCGADFLASFTTPEAAPVGPAAGVIAPAWATPDNAGVGSTLGQRLFAVGRLRAGWRLVGIATFLTAGAFATYRIDVATPDAVDVASQPIVTGEHSAPAATSFAPAVAEPKPAESETTTTVQAPMAKTKLEAPPRASLRHRPVPVPATKRTGARQRPAPDVPVAVAGTQTHAAARVGVTETRKAHPPDPWEAMHVSLAACGGDLIARILCDQRVRRRFCEGHWGEAPECGSVPNDHGQ